MLDRAARLEAREHALREAAGTGTVAGNLTGALTTLFEPVPVAIIPLITFRYELRARLRRARPGGGIAILAEVTTAVSAYLADERARGCVAPDADLDSLALSLVGGGHLLFADRDPGPPTEDTVHRLVVSVLAGHVRGGRVGNRAGRGWGPRRAAGRAGTRSLSDDVSGKGQASGFSPAATFLIRSTCALANFLCGRVEFLAPHLDGSDDAAHAHQRMRAYAGRRSRRRSRTRRPPRPPSVP